MVFFSVCRGGGEEDGILISDTNQNDEKHLRSTFCGLVQFAFPSRMHEMSGGQCGLCIFLLSNKMALKSRTLLTVENMIFISMKFVHYVCRFHYIYTPPSASKICS